MEVWWSLGSYLLREGLLEVSSAWQRGCCRNLAVVGLPGAGLGSPTKKKWQC